MALMGWLDGYQSIFHESDHVKVCCANMADSMEQRIFLALEFYFLNHSVMEARRFHRKFHATVRQTNSTIKCLFAPAGI